MTDQQPGALRDLMADASDGLAWPPDMLDRVIVGSGRRRTRRRRLLLASAAASLVGVVAVAGAVAQVGTTTSATPAHPGVQPSVATSSSTAPQQVPIPAAAAWHLVASLPYAILATGGAAGPDNQVVAFLGQQHNLEPGNFVTLCTGLLPRSRPLSEVQLVGSCQGLLLPASKFSKLAYGPEPVPYTAGAGTSTVFGVLDADVTSAKLLLATPAQMAASSTPSGGTPQNVTSVDVQMLPVVRVQGKQWRFFEVTYPGSLAIAGITGRDIAGQVILNQRYLNYCGYDPKLKRIGTPCPPH